MKRFLRLSALIIFASLFLLSSCGKIAGYSSFKDGVKLYNQKKYFDAADAFSNSALQLRGGTDSARAYYNAGNSWLNSILDSSAAQADPKVAQDPNAAEKALDCYKRTVSLINKNKQRELYKKATINAEISRQLIDQKKESDENKKNQDKDNQDSKGQDNKGQDNKGQDNKGQDNKGQDNKGQDNKGQDSKGQDSKEGRGKDFNGQQKNGDSGSSQQKEDAKADQAEKSDETQNQTADPALQSILSQERETELYMNNLKRKGNVQDVEKNW